MSRIVAQIYDSVVKGFIKRKAISSHRFRLREELYIIIIIIIILIRILSRRRYHYDMLLIFKSNRTRLSDSIWCSIEAQQVPWLIISSVDSHKSDSDNVMHSDQWTSRCVPVHTLTSHNLHRYRDKTAWKYMHIYINKYIFFLPNISSNLSNRELSRKRQSKDLQHKRELSKVLEAKPPSLNQFMFRNKKSESEKYQQRYTHPME